MGSATSSPDPLAVDGPEDRDIDVLVRPPDLAGRCYVETKKSRPVAA